MVNGESASQPEKVARTGLRIPLSVLLPNLVLILVLLGLYFWSREGSTTHVKIEAKGDQYTLFLDGREISSASLLGRPTGGIGYEQSSNPLPHVPRFQTIKNIVVTDLDSGVVLFQENFEGSELDTEKWPYTQGTWEVEDCALTAKEEQAAIFHFEKWKNYTLEADVGNIIGAKFFVRAQDRSHYVGCKMRPFRHFDSGFYVVKGGRQSNRTRNQHPLISPYESIKRSLNLILYYLPHAILLFVLLVILSLLLLLFLYWF